MSGPHRVIERGPWCTSVVHVFRIVLVEEHTVHMDDDGRVRMVALLSKCPASSFVALGRSGSFFEV